jgi:hypothetical protein
VNKAVEKHPLDTLEAGNRAGFNKLPIGRAASIPLKIKGLQEPVG